MPSSDLNSQNDEQAPLDHTRARVDHAIPEEHSTIVRLFVSHIVNSEAPDSILITDEHRALDAIVRQRLVKSGHLKPITPATPQFNSKSRVLSGHPLCLRLLACIGLMFVYMAIPHSKQTQTDDSLSESQLKFDSPAQLNHIGNDDNESRAHIALANAAKYDLEFAGKLRVIHERLNAIESIANAPIRYLDEAEILEKNEILKQLTSVKKRVVRVHKNIELELAVAIGRYRNNLDRMVLNSTPGTFKDKIEAIRILQFDFENSDIGNIQHFYDKTHVAVKCPDCIELESKSQSSESLDG